VAFRRLYVPAIFKPRQPAIGFGMRHAQAGGLIGRPRRQCLLPERLTLLLVIEDMPEQFREWLIDFGDSG